MSLVTLASQLVERSKTQLYEAGLAVATALGLSVTSWAPGDPTRSLYHFLADVVRDLEVNVAGYVASGFLDHATGDWLTLLAKQVYNVDRVEATYASTTVTLTNTSGGLYVLAAGDVTAQSSTSGKTYRNTSGGTLAASDGITPTTLALDFIADEPGSDSSASATEIDTLVTTLLGVTCSNATGALGLDEEDNASLRDRCRAKLGTLSPNGPADAYSFVVRSSELTGVTDITRARVVGDSATGDVTVYVAGANGPVAGASVTAAQDAVEEWATPLTITPTVSNASGVTVNVIYELWMYASVGETQATIKAAISAALTAMFAARPIGGDIIAPAATGKLYHSLIVSTIKEVYPDHTFRVSVTSPAADTSLTIDAVAVLDHDTSTDAVINLEVDP